MTPPVPKSLISFSQRSSERRLTILALAIHLLMILLSQGVWNGISQQQFQDWLIPVAFIISTLLAHSLLVFLKLKADQTILPVLTLINGFGLAFQYRLGTYSIDKWKDLSLLISIAVPLIAVITAAVFSKNRIRWLYLSRDFWIACMYAIPVLTIVMGVRYRGGNFGPGLTTPAEFIKPLFVIGLSSILFSISKSYQSQGFLHLTWKNHLPLLWIWGIPQLLYLYQRDLGVVAATTLILIMVLYGTTGRMIYLLAGVSGFCTAGLVFSHFIPRGQVRFEAWLNPFLHPDGAGFQMIQSLFALFHGELLGQGIGNGFPDKVPLVTNDFVYSSIAEETGLAGSLLVILGIFFLARKGYQAAYSNRDPFMALIAQSSAAALWIQAFLNVGGVIKMIPLTGVPFPFVSHGGSACIAFAIMIGWIISATDSK